MAGKAIFVKCSEICRTCMATTNLKPIFSGTTEPEPLSHKIMACAAVQIAENDGLPLNICEACITAVNNAFEFKKRCEEMDTYFHIHNYTVKNVNSETEFYFGTQEIKDEEVVETPDHEEEVVSNNEGFDGVFETNSNDSWTPSAEEKKPLTKTPIKRLQRCKICDLKFESRDEYKAHLETHPRIKRVPCTICQKELSVNHIYRHMRVHTKEKTFSCHICGKCFSSGFNLDRHVKTHTGEKPYKCSVCEKAFIQAVTLEAHMRIHTGETPFICSFCGQAFKQSKQCRHHVQKKHTNPPSDASPAPRRRKPEGSIRRKKSPGFVDRPFACEVCGRRFTMESALKTHRLQHGEKTFLCSVCGKRFVSKVALNIHNIVHSDTKPHVCDICNKAFAYKSSRNIHMLKHTGEKRHTCHICGKKFLQSAHLTTHLRLHDGMKPFHCSICGKAFSLKGNLTVHTRIHTGEKPYKCEFCDKGFCDSSSMRKHQQAHGQKTIVIKTCPGEELLQN